MKYNLMYDSVGNPDCFVSESGDWFQSWETGKISQEPNFELIDNGVIDVDNIIIPAIEIKQESISEEETNISGSIDS
jgi:hypothetical protein